MAANTALKQQLQAVTSTNASLENELNEAKDIIAETRCVIRQEQQEVANATKNFADSEEAYKRYIGQVGGCVCLCTVDTTLSSYTLVMINEQ